MDCSTPGSLVLHDIPAHQAPLSFTISQSLLRFMSIELVMLSNYPILCCPFLFLPSIFLSIRVFSNELILRIIWPEHWSLGFSISTSDEYSGLISLGLTDLISLQSKGFSSFFSSTITQRHQFFGPQPFLWSNFHTHK